MQIKHSDANTMHLPGRKIGRKVQEEFALTRLWLLEIGTHCWQRSKVCTYKAKPYTLRLQCTGQYLAVVDNGDPSVALSVSLSRSLSFWLKKEAKCITWVWWFKINHWQLEGRRHVKNEGRDRKLETEKIWSLFEMGW